MQEKGHKCKNPDANLYIQKQPLLGCVFENFYLFPIQKSQTVINCEDKEPSDFNGKIIRYSDNVKFRTIKKVTELFKTIKYRQQCAWFKIKENEYLWCPKLDLIENEYKNCKWKNKISIDGTEIYESLREGKKEDENSLNWNEKRITFAYYNDENGFRMYKYRGIFILDKEATKKYNFEKRVWKKYTDKLDISQY